MIKIDNIRLNLDESEDKLLEKACKKNRIDILKVKYFRIRKKSLDARNKADLHYIYSVELDYKKFTEQSKKNNYSYPDKKIVVVGSGPAGLFSALMLSRAGFKIILIERGSKVEDRKKKIDNFINTRKLDTETNIQFGEGGAGTFSDGKLNTSVKSEYKEKILDEFIHFGAPEEIAYINKPHIGSDILPSVIENMRKEIISLNGEVLFDTKLIDLEITDNNISSIKVLHNQNERVIEVSNVIMAIGHSARDTFYMLNDKGVFMEQKDLAIGLRIEHKQKMINESQYGKKNMDKNLPSADYKLTSSFEGRGVFTFCMCPGGYVMPATSEESAVVTNGMSNYSRDGENANSAVVVQVRKEDYGEGTMAGIEYLRELEKKAFIYGGSDYSAPCQLVGDFLSGKESKKIGNVIPSYKMGYKFARLDKLLPGYIVEPLKYGIKDMDKRLRGFAINDGVLTGVETRTSSPVRITRNEKLCSVNIENLYPSGEVGYAGGIMSSAIDGMKVSEAIMEKYKNE